MLENRARWGSIAVFSLALLLRLGYLYELSDSPLFAAPVVDARTYVEEARYLSEVSWTGKQAPFWQPPLYPYALAALFALGGENYYLPRLLQALLGAMVCVLTYLLGRQIFGTGIGLAAALFAAGYGPLIYFGGELLPVLPAVFLNLLLLYLLATGHSQPRYLFIGFLTGLSALTVANILLFLPVLLGWLYWNQKREGHAPRAALKAPALLLIGCTLVIAPVTWRNFAVGDDLVLISHNAGINFYIGNNAEYERTTTIRPGREWLELVETPAREAGIEKASEKSRYFFGLSWDYISAQPLDFMELLAYKGYLFLRGDEIPRNLDLYYARTHSRLLSLLMWKDGLAFPFGLVVPFALLGLYAFWRSPEGRSPEGRLLLLFVATYAASIVLFFVTSRYRMPAVPPLLLFAAFGVRALWFLPRPALIAVPVLLLLCNAGTGKMNRDGDAHEHYWLGYAYEQKGMPANAARHYRQVIEENPSFGDPFLNLAALHGEAEHLDKAIDLYRRYLDHHQDEDVRFQLGNTCLLARRYSEAAEIYTQVAAARPKWAAIHGRLGYTHLMTNRPELASAAYRRTLELNPDSTLVRYQLARLYANEGQTDQAIGEFHKLQTRMPQVSEYRIRLADLIIEQEQQIADGTALAQTARLAEAEAHLRHTIELAPQAAHSHWSLGMLYARQGRHPEAIPLFEKLIEIAPRDYQAHIFLGHLYQRSGRTDDADAEFEAFSRKKRAYRLEKTARREFETQIKDLFGG